MRVFSGFQEFVDRFWTRPVIAAWRDNEERGAGIFARQVSSCRMTGGQCLPQGNFATATAPLGTSPELLPLRCRIGLVDL